jgi:hypothetical protein
VRSPKVFMILVCVAVSLGSLGQTAHAGPAVPGDFSCYMDLQAIYYPNGDFWRIVEYSGSDSCTIAMTSLRGQIGLLSRLGTREDGPYSFTCSLCNIDGVGSDYLTHIYTSHRAIFDTTLTAPPGYTWVYWPPECIPRGSDLICEFKYDFTIDELAATRVRGDSATAVRIEG